MKLKIYKYPLKMKDSQVISSPAESTVLSIKNQHEVPVLYAAVNTACEIEGYVNIELDENYYTQGIARIKEHKI
ncbi:TPA_asm: hypothetical protein GEU60_00485 [Listeria monocytogenes]|nr:hypothetical protein [Listeria monocytogenes]